MGRWMVGVSSFLISAIFVRLSRAGTAMGDWFHTERSWRRLVHGKIQQADLVDEAPNAVVCVIHFFPGCGLNARCSRLSTLGVMSACLNAV